MIKNDIYKKVKELNLSLDKTIDIQKLIQYKIFQLPYFENNFNDFKVSTDLELKLKITNNEFSLNTVEKLYRHDSIIVLNTEQEEQMKKIVIILEENNKLKDIFQALDPSDIKLMKDVQLGLNKFVKILDLLEPFLDESHPYNSHKKETIITMFSMQLEERFNFSVKAAISSISKTYYYEDLDEYLRDLIGTGELGEYDIKGILKLDNLEHLYFVPHIELLRKFILNEDLSKNTFLGNLISHDNGMVDKWLYFYDQLLIDNEKNVYLGELKVNMKIPNVNNFINSYEGNVEKIVNEIIESHPTLLIPKSSINHFELTEIITLNDDRTLERDEFYSSLDICDISEVDNDQYIAHKGFINNIDLSRNHYDDHPADDNGTYEYTTFVATYKDEVNTLGMFKGVLVNDQKTVSKKTELIITEYGFYENSEANKQIIDKFLDYCVDNELILIFNDDADKKIINISKLLVENMKNHSKCISVIYDDEFYSNDLGDYNNWVLDITGDFNMNYKDTKKMVSYLDKEIKPSNGQISDEVKEKAVNYITDNIQTPKKSLKIQNKLK